MSHIEIINSLLEAGIEPDIVCGTSIGSLIGAAYVAGKLGELRRWAEAATWREVVELIDIRLSGGGLIKRRSGRQRLVIFDVEGEIESYSKPYAAIATNLASGREIWLRTGPIEAAVRASIALPECYRPARIGDEWLVDGGLPIRSRCRFAGLFDSVTIAVNLNGDLLGRRFASEVNRETPVTPRTFRTSL